MQEKIRIAKYLAQAGVASRRKAEELISAGLVKVNGQKILDLSFKVSPADEVKVKDKKLELQERVYYLLNKPQGYVCSVDDPHNSLNVTQLVPKHPPVFPVGRLDKDSSGLVLLTNDGDLAYRLSHPKFQIPKKYLVIVDKHLPENVINKLLKGVRLKEGLAKADAVKIVSEKNLEITLHQGWNHQIRRMLDKLGYQVIELIRVAEGKLSLGNLKPGKYLKTSYKEIMR